jgi:hypothetical protein
MVLDELVEEKARAKGRRGVQVDREDGTARALGAGDRERASTRRWPVGEDDGRIGRLDVLSGAFLVLDARGLLELVPLRNDSVFGEPPLRTETTAGQTKIDRRIEAAAVGASLTAGVATPRTSGPRAEGGSRCRSFGWLDRLLVLPTPPQSRIRQTFA